MRDDDWQFWKDEELVETHKESSEI